MSARKKTGNDGNRPMSANGSRSKRKASTGGGAGVQFLAEKVERWPIGKLRPNERNAKKHPLVQVRQIAKSIKEWGFTMPLVISEDGVIQAGEGRWLAAKHLEMTEVPVIVARGWSPTKLRAYVLADNKISENGSWDTELLASELTELRLDPSEYLSLTGFSDAQIKRLLPGDQRFGMGGVEPIFQVLIECENEAQQTRLLEQLRQEGQNCRALIQ
jgi:ParB-like chromosome segregation protein Spo0J